MGIFPLLCMGHKKGNHKSWLYWGKGGWRRSFPNLMESASVRWLFVPSWCWWDWPWLGSWLRSWILLGPMGVQRTWKQDGVISSGHSVYSGIANPDGGFQNEKKEMGGADASSLWGPIKCLSQVFLLPFMLSKSPLCSSSSKSPVTSGRISCIKLSPD